MIITDPLSNLFSNIKNGYLSKKTKIIYPNTKQTLLVLNIFIKQGLIKSYTIDSSIKLNLNIFLKYKYNKPVLKDIKRISKPGKRIYIKNKDLYLKNKYFYLLSTSSGIVTNLQAKQLNIGGELLCQIF